MNLLTSATDGMDLISMYRPPARMMSGFSLGHNIGGERGERGRGGRFKKIQNHNDLEIPFPAAAMAALADGLPALRAETIS